MALGLGLALAATRLMKELLFGISPSGPVVFVTISLMLGCVGLFACWLPARRAAALDPVKALRHESFMAAQLPRSFSFLADAGPRLGFGCWKRS